MRHEGNISERDKKIINNDDNADAFDDKKSDIDKTRVDVNGDKLDYETPSHYDIKTSNENSRSKEEEENDHAPIDNSIRENAENFVMEKENIAPNQEIHEFKKDDNKKRDRNTGKPHSNDKKNSKISSYFSIKSVDFINNTKIVQPSTISSIDKSVTFKIEDEMMDTANSVCCIDTILELKINTEKENTSCSNIESASSSSSSHSLPFFSSSSSIIETENEAPKGISENIINFTSQKSITTIPNVEHTVESSLGEAKALLRHGKLWSTKEAERMRKYRAKQSEDKLRMAKKAEKTRNDRDARKSIEIEGKENDSTQSDEGDDSDQNEGRSGKGIHSLSNASVFTLSVHRLICDLYFISILDSSLVANSNLNLKYFHSKEQKV